MFRNICKIFLLTLLMSSFSASACIDYGNMNQVYLFGINLLGKNELENFYYNYPYSEDWCDPGNDQNIAEWQKRYPEVKDVAAFHELIYQMSVADVQRLSGATGAANALAAALVQKNDQAVIDYLVFAKTCEPHVKQNSDESWEERMQSDEEPSTNKAAMRGLIDRGIDLYNQTTDVFLKQRYALQIMRLAYYMDDYNNALLLFDQVVKPDMGKNYVYYRTLMHKAFALKQLKRVAEANLLLAEIFEKAPALRCLAYSNLLLGEAYPVDATVAEQVWQQTLAKAQNDQQKTLLFMLRNIQQNKFDISLLNDMYRFASPAGMEVVMLKQLKHIETNIFIPYLQRESKLDSAALTYGEMPMMTDSAPEENLPWWKSWWRGIVNFFKGLFGSKDKGELSKTVLKAQVESPEPTAIVLPENLKDSKEITELKGIALKAAKDKKTPRPALFYLSAAYLSIMQQEFGDSRDHISSARNSIGSDDKALAAQATYLEALTAVMEADKIDEDIEQLVYDKVNTLWQDSTLNGGWQKLFLFSEMGRRYLKNDDLTKAILTYHFVEHQDIAYSLVDIYATQADLDNLLAYVKSNPGSNFEKMIVKDFTIVPGADLADVIRDIQGTKLAREGRFSDALAKLKTVSANYWKKTPPSYVENEESGKITTTWGGNMGTAYYDFYNGYHYYYSGCDTFPTSFIDNAAERSKEFGSYYKLTFLEKIVEMEQKANTAKDAEEKAQYYFKIANGFAHSPFWAYNSSLWKCNMMLGAVRSVTPTAYPLNLDNISTNYHNRKMAFVRSYCRPYWAVEFYKKAAATTQDRELAATALFCARAAAETEMASYWEEPIRLGSDQFFATMKSKYADTKTYERLNESCSYLRDFKVQ